MALGICFGVMVLLYLTYQYVKFQPAGENNVALALKGLTTLTAAVLAFIGMRQGAHLWLCIGLFVCAIADVVLARSFLMGTGAFALGHVAYIVACVQLAPPTALSIGVFIALVLVCAVLYHHLSKNHHPPASFLAYGLVLCALLGAAVTQKPLLLAGALLFVISDGMLASRILTKKESRPFDYLSLGCYYLAQYLIAASVWC